MSSFASTYREARGKFLSAATARGARLCAYERDDLRGAEDEVLACDVAILGDAHADRAVVSIAGVHGAEGFCGAAIFHHWLTTRSGLADRTDVRIVLVHAVNPWAFSFKTRTTENNVDLNRNFLAAYEYSRLNAAYDRLLPFLHETAPAGSLDAGRMLDAYRAYRAYLDANGAAIETEMLEGQTHRPEGLYYAGRTPEWSNLTFRRIVRDELEGATRIGFIDWHTGLGDFGEVVCLGIGNEGAVLQPAFWTGAEAEIVYRAGRVPAYRGLLCNAIGQELPDATVSGAVVEFGTADDYTMFRADRLDRWLRFERRDDADFVRLREEYQNVCCPSDPTWRRTVLREGLQLLDRLVASIAAG